MVALAVLSTSPGISAPRRPANAASHRATNGVGLGALLGATALLYLWPSSASGWSNEYYAAAAQAGAQSWKAFFFGSLDAATVRLVLVVVVLLALLRIPLPTPKNLAKRP